MATLVFSALGTLLGGPLGGAIGALAGRQVDAMLLGGGSREGPRLAELAVTTSSYGMPVARHFGTMRVAGQIIWATDLREHSNRHGNGKGKPSTTEYSYTASFAVTLSSRSIQDIGRVWADGKLLRGAAGDLKTAGTFRFYRGAGDQPVDPLLAAAESAGHCPAYRGQAYAVFEDLQLGDFGNRIPALTFEVIADTAPLSIATLLEDVVAEADAAVPLDGLAGLSCEGAIGDLLGALDPLFPVDCDACGSRLTIRADRLQAAPIALPEAATSSSRDDFGGNAGFARKRAPETEQPVAVLRYYDIDRDYQPGAQRAGGLVLPGQPRTIELPAAMAAQAARGLVERAYKRAHWARQTVSWRMTQLDPAVRPGATVTLPDHPGLWRVREWEWREHGVDLSLTRLSPVASATVAVDPGRALPAADVALPVTVLAVCELPWDGNPAAPVPLILAAASSASSAWTGASLYVDQGDGALLPLGPSGRGRATIGTATTVLPPASPLLFDRHGSVSVRLAGDDLALQDATMRQLAMGANRALLGEEIIQFALAEPLGGGQWRLSGLWRGRGGTEDAVATHASGEAFVLLDGGGTVLDAEAVGEVPATTIAAIGLADSAPVSAPIALRGIGKRPLAPVHGRCTVLSNGDRRLTWTRRARGAWVWADNADAPLNEQAEVYEIGFGPVASPLARWESTAPDLLVSAAQWAGLAPLAPSGPFTVRQRGDGAASQPLVIHLR
jgi:hypothetical protein